MVCERPRVAIRQRAGLVHLFRWRKSHQKLIDSALEYIHVDVRRKAVLDAPAL